MERTIKIESIKVNIFSHPSKIARDSTGHAHPGEEVTTKTAMLTLTCDDGSQGYAFSSPELVRPYVVNGYFKKVLIGQNPFNRERIWDDFLLWQRGSTHQLSDRSLAVVENALWDLIGRKLNLPVHKILGGYRDKVPAYGSTMCGDELVGGLATPKDYANFAVQLVKKGYKAIKLHTWMPPVSFAPSPKMDVKACAAVREAVGSDIDLFLDGYHWYSRSEALYVGRELEKLNFTWFEEPMEEQSMDAYVWLTKNLDIDVIGPESLGGKYYSRADWIKYNACDILRAGSPNAGGISSCLRVAHLAQSFNMDCEVHGNGAANLQVIGAIKNCRWYERGLLHPFLDYDKPPAYLNSIIDPMDAEGFVHLPTLPGLGEDINFDYINEHTESITG